jgi:hypothetical protein
MERNPVSRGYPGPDPAGQIARDVQHRQILNVGTFTDLDELISPRSTLPCQMLAWGPMRTSPMR